MSVARYRVCRNEAPHCKTWWTVEKRKRGLFWRSVWKRQCRLVPSQWSGCTRWYEDYSWPSESEARAWVEEDKRPCVHACGEPE